MVDARSARRQRISASLQDPKTEDGERTKRQMLDARFWMLDTRTKKHEEESAGGKYHGEFAVFNFQESK